MELVEQLVGRLDPPLLAELEAEGFTIVPSARATQPGAIRAPTRLARRILFAAICDVPMSKTNGGISPAGAAHAIGFVPSAGLAPPNGATDGGAATVCTMTNPARAAISQ